MRKCETCKFSEGFSNIDGGVLACHRFPPVPIQPGETHPKQFDDLVDGSRQTSVGLWPMVLTDDWCGEYQEDAST